MIKLQIASIPFWPRTLRNSCPIGSGKSVARMSDTDAVAYEAAMSKSHPKEHVAATEINMAIGAALAAPAVSSEI